MEEILPGNAKLLGTECQKCGDLISLNQFGSFLTQYTTAETYLKSFCLLFLMTIELLYLET